MGNTESNESNAAGSGDGDSPRRPKDNTTAAAAAAAAAALAAVALTGWGLTKLVSSSASKEDEKTSNDKGKLMVGGGSSRGYPTNYFVDSPPYTASQMKTLMATGNHASCRRKLKMNTDGSVRGDPARAGFGGVIRDENGSWVMGFYGRISEECTIEQAEILGIYHGLKIILDEKFEEVEIESDCEAAITHLTGKTRRKSPIDDIIQECKKMLQRTGCPLNHTPGEENKVADRLADLGRTQETSLVRLSTPPDKKTEMLLEADATLASSY